MPDNARRFGESIIRVVEVLRSCTLLLSTARIDAAIEEGHPIAEQLEAHRRTVKLVIGVALGLVDIRDPRPGQWVLHKFLLDVVKMRM